MDMKKVSKSEFKAHALEFFRQVEQTGQELIITDRGRPVLKIMPLFAEPEKLLKSLQGTVIEYEGPTEPVGLDQWESLSDSP
jgi:prevent-host-death family protein